MDLTNRLKETMRASGLNPRSLSAVSKVHYTTIYKIVNNKNPNPLLIVIEALNNALDKIDKLVAEGYLPFKYELTNEQKTEQLKALFERH